MRWMAGLVGSMLAVLAIPASAQFAAGSFGEAVSQQLCQSGDQGSCSPAEAEQPSDQAPIDFNALRDRCIAGENDVCVGLARHLKGRVEGFQQAYQQESCGSSFSFTAKCEELRAAVPQFQQFAVVAAEFYMRACDGKIAISCSEGGNFARWFGGPGAGASAVAFNTKGCALDDVGNCIDLGKLQKNGLGDFAADAVAARKTYAKICTKWRYTDSCFVYGVMLAEGSGGSVDTVEARKVHLANCEPPGNERHSCFAAATMMRDGIGGKVDKPGALKAFASACNLYSRKNGIEEACEEMKKLEQP